MYPASSGSRKTGVLGDVIVSLLASGWALNCSGMRSGVQQMGRHVKMWRNRENACGLDNWAQKARSIPRNCAGLHAVLGQAKHYSFRGWMLPRKSSAWHKWTFHALKFSQFVGGLWLFWPCNFHQSKLLHDLATANRGENNPAGSGPCLIPVGPSHFWLGRDMVHFYNSLSTGLFLPEKQKHQGII